MHVYECMATQVKTCVPESSCEKAGEIMRRHHRGFLSIVDSLKRRRVVGVVTDRDIMLHLTYVNLPASKLAVKVCMRAAPPMISREADLEVAVRVMEKEALYQLPVIDEGKLVGMLSLEDIALAVHRQWAYIGPHVTEQNVTAILEAIAVARERRQRNSRS